MHSFLFLCDFNLYFVGCFFFNKFLQENVLNPLHPNISMHILHTVLCTFPKVQTRRICYIYIYNVRGSLKGTYLKSDSYANDFATLQSNMRLPG